MSEHYLPGANWTSKDGRRHIVIVREIHSHRGRAFTIRNLSTGRESQIEISGLSRKFNFGGYDPAFEDRL